MTSCLSEIYICIQLSESAEMNDMIIYCIHVPPFKMDLSYTVYVTPPLFCQNF